MACGQGSLKQLHKATSEKYLNGLPLTHTELTLTFSRNILQISSQMNSKKKNLKRISLIFLRI